MPYLALCSKPGEAVVRNVPTGLRAAGCQALETVHVGELEGA